MGAALNTTKVVTVKAATEKVAVTIRENAVTEEKVFESWIKFPSQIRSMTSLHFLFSKAPLWEPETNCIVTEVPGDLIASQLQDIMETLTKFMRDSLQNDKVYIKVTIREMKREDIDTSPKGKAQAMAKKNSQLRDLCRRLHLDFA